MEKPRTGLSALLLPKATKLSDLSKTSSKRKQFPQQGNKDMNNRQENRNLYTGTLVTACTHRAPPNIKTTCSIIAVPSPPELTTTFVKGVAAFFSLSMPSPAPAPTSPGSSHAWTTSTLQASIRTTTPSLLLILVDPEKHYIFAHDLNSVTIFPLYILISYILSQFVQQASPKMLLAAIGFQLLLHNLSKKAPTVPVQLHCEEF